MDPCDQNERFQTCATLQLKAKSHETNSQSFNDLARVKSIVVKAKNAEKPKKSVMKATTHTEIFLPWCLNVHIECVECSNV